MGGEWDLALIERAFSGEYLTHGVKTRRSQFARVPAAPVHQAITEALEVAGLDATDVFTSRDAAAWWRALERAAKGDRSVSFLTAAGSIRAAARAGAEVDADRMHERLGGVVRARLTGPVLVRSQKTDAATQLDLRDLELESLTDIELGSRVWQSASDAAGRHEIAGNAGYELTLTLPKSFSLYAITGDPADQGLWMDALEAAAKRALERLMAEAGFCSTGHRGDGENVTILEADGWAGFIATEISSRAGDPHLHVHCSLPNVLVGRDGVVRTMADGGRELIINAPRFAAWGQEYVIAEARARGLLDEVRFSATSGEWEVGMFSDEHIAAFSRGRQAILAAEDETSDGVARNAKGRARAQRGTKTRVTAAKADAQPTWAQLRADVLARATAQGWDMDTLRAGSLGAANYWYRPPAQWTDAQWTSWVEWTACRHESTTSLAKIRSLVDLTTVDMPAEERARILRVVVEHGFERADTSRDLGMKTGGQQWISRTALDHEARLLARMQASVDLTASRDLVLHYRRAPEGVARFEAQRGWPLTDEQTRAVDAIVDGFAPITLISGVGGSGKTSVLAAAHLALGDGEMLVTSTATRAASKAGHESGAPWMNLTALCSRITSDETIDARVIVVDEASMADVRSLATVSDWCQANHRRLIAAGRRRAAARGGCRRRVPRPVRHAPGRGRAAADEPASAHRGRPRPRRGPARPGPRRRVGGAAPRRHHAWSRSTTTRSSPSPRRQSRTTPLDHGAENVTCDAVTNAEAAELNERIHRLLLERGTLDDQAAITYRTPTAEKTLAPGTVLRVVTPVTGRDEQRRLVRDQRATVLAVEPDRVRIRLDDGRERTMSPPRPPAAPGLRVRRHHPQGPRPDQRRPHRHRPTDQGRRQHVCLGQPGEAGHVLRPRRPRLPHRPRTPAGRRLDTAGPHRRGPRPRQDRHDPTRRRHRLAQPGPPARAPGSNPPQSLGYAPLPTHAVHGLRTHLGTRQAQRDPCRPAAKSPSHPRR